jgi:hypothetical protein
MASGGDHSDEFIHQVAIKLSRAMVMLNPAISVNPNDLLARNVINMAQDNEAVEQFMKGLLSVLASLHRCSQRPTFSCQIFWQVSRLLLV